MGELLYPEGAGEETCFDRAIGHIRELLGTASSVVWKISPETALNFEESVLIGSLGLFLTLDAKRPTSVKLTMVPLPGAGNGIQTVALFLQVNVAHESDFYTPELAREAEGIVFGVAEKTGPRSMFEPLRGENVLLALSTVSQAHRQVGVLQKQTLFSF